MTFLQVLLNNGEYAPPRHILTGLRFEQVTCRPEGAVHSLYEELWHTDYWQRIMLSRARGEVVSGGFDFPSEALTNQEDWEALVSSFLRGLQEALELARDEERLRQPSHGDRTVREELEALAVHNAYHFGKIVLLRQLLGCWQPADA